MNSVIPDIPRMHTAIAEWLACVLYLIPLKKRFSTRNRIALYAVFLGLLIVPNLASEIVSVSFWMLAMLFCMGLMYLMILTCSSCSAVEAGYYWSRAFLVAEFAASLEWQIYYYISLAGAGGTVQMWLCMWLTYAAVYTLMYLLERNRLYGKGRFNITIKEMIGAVLISVGAFLWSNVNYAFQNNVFSESLGAGILYARTLVDLAGIIMLFTHEEQRREFYLHYELDAMDSLLNRQYAQYQQYVENTEAVQRIYHDLKHQIQFIREETDADKRERYLSEMADAINVYESNVHTGNSVLDTIIGGKSLVCAQSGISMTCYADAKRLDFMDVMDICALFGNALDNAIEYEEKVPDPDRRLIKVTVGVQENFLLIRVENYCIEDIAIVGDAPETTKAQKELHGFGIKSIRRVAEKYGGHMTLGNQDSWFFLNILIPLPEA